MEFRGRAGLRRGRRAASTPAPAPAWHNAAPLDSMSARTNHWNSSSCSISSALRGDRVEVGRLGEGSAVVGDRAVVDEVEGCEVRLDALAAAGLVVPRSGGGEVADRPDRRAADGFAQHRRSTTPADHALKAAHPSPSRDARPATCALARVIAAWHVLKIASPRRASRVRIERPRERPQTLGQLRDLGSAHRSVEHQRDDDIVLLVDTLVRVVTERALAGRATADSSSAALSTPLPGPTSRRLIATTSAALR